MGTRKNYGDRMRQSHAGVTYDVTEKRTSHDPAAYAAALEQAHGDARRLRIEDDGSITILNRPKTASTSPFR